MIGDIQRALDALRALDEAQTALNEIDTLTEARLAALSTIRDLAAAEIKRTVTDEGISITTPRLAAAANLGTATVQRWKKSARETAATTGPSS